MAASATIEALGVPRRRQILDVLRGGEQPAQVLALELGLSQPAVSKHLRVLGDSGLVSVRPDARVPLVPAATRAARRARPVAGAYRQLWRGQPRQA
jgi:DNA-binding transcriptional ArsR family regulator